MMHHLPVTTETELQKCKEDPVYFYEKYLLIDGKEPRPLFEHEKVYLRMLNDGQIRLKRNGRGEYTNVSVSFSGNAMIINRKETKKKKRYGAI